MPILLYLFSSIIYLGLLLYFRRGWNRIKPWNKSTEEHRTTVTVVVVARNEANRIKPLLESLINQHYPKKLLECIVVDDHSIDGTVSLVESYAQHGIRLLHLSDDKGIESSVSPKKQGITYAIAESKGELIITTDADCRMGPDWVASAVSRFELDRPDMLVMPVRMIGGNGLAALFQTLDFMMLQAITAAFHGLMKPVLCNGANLAYTREVFESAGGFVGNDHLASGDDLFLLHKVTSMYNRKVIYHLSDKAMVDTSPESGWLAFLRQRIRWGSKSRHYRDGSLLPVLSFVFLYNIMSFFSLMVLVILLLKQDAHWKEMLLIFGIGFGTKMIAELILLIPAARFFKLQKKIFWFPLLQPLHVFYTVFAGFLSQFRTYTWKGRRLR